jgi:hypothetical protein
MVVNPGDSFASVSESFAVILNGLNKFLDQYDTPPSIKNPAMPGENFDRHWKGNAEEFKKFKKAIAKYAEIANDAVALFDDEALEKWTELFGDEFAPAEANKASFTGAMKNSSGNSDGFVPRNPWCQL